MESLQKPGMGAWFESILIKTEDAEMVERTLRGIAKASDCKFLVGPALDGWTSIFPSESHEISDEIGPALAVDLFHLLVHDDDAFIYYFYRGGRLMDHYISWPDYFDEISERETLETRGKPEVFRDLLPQSESFSKLKALLAEEKFVFENERMSRFVDLMGLKNAVGGYKYLQAGEMDDIEEWDKFIHIEGQPDTAEHFNKRGEKRHALNRLDDALGDFDEAIKLNPSFAAAYNNRGLAKKSKSDEAQKLAEALVRAVKVNLTFAEAYKNRDFAKESKDNLSGALEDFSRAIELRPDWVEPYANRAGIRKTQDDSRGELADYNRIIQLGAASATIYNSRGETKRKLGDLAGALGDYEKAVELDPTFAAAYNNRA
ncbi:MAG TPA: tetratricopeptide repeat protein, partial [Verrucomicrobiae bacterium]|nr:tetratricopeptide repeat protein [Verrucomicrobiae bacterium]